MAEPVDVAGAVEIDGIAQRLGSRWALRGVSMSVGAGELVAVVGHNGSGKTTLLRVLATALRPTRGSGRIFGCDLVHDADAVRTMSAMLAHAGGLYGDLTAAENLSFAQRMLGAAHDPLAIKRALERVGMERFAGARVRTFSSGMRRRTAIARLYLRRVRMLLLDEPYNSLDTAGMELIDELLADVRDRGGSGIVVLHDLGRTRTEFDRVIELRQGRVVGAGVRSVINVA